MKDVDQNDAKAMEKAKALSAEIEETYSKMDLEFESKAKGGYKHVTETLNDDELTDLFNEMKKDTMVKREKEMGSMQKFKFDAKDDDGDDDGLLEELGGLEDSEEEEKKQEENLAVTDEDPHFFNDRVKQQLEAYRQMKKRSMMQNKTADGNLDQIFENF